MGSISHLLLHNNEYMREIHIDVLQASPKQGQIEERNEISLLNERVF